MIGASWLASTASQAQSVNTLELSRNSWATFLTGKTASSYTLSPPLNALVEEFSKWWSEREQELNKTNEVVTPLYHYTDMGGLVGIVTSETITLTSIFHLNDPSELAYGIELADWVALTSARLFFTLDTQPSRDDRRPDPRLRDQPPSASYALWRFELIAHKANDAGADNCLACSLARLSDMSVPGTPRLSADGRFQMIPAMKRSSDITLRGRPHGHGPGYTRAVV